MVQDHELMRAVSQILQRSERQEDSGKLLETFVDVGVLPQFRNRNNQILYGRRGTGKTHVLRVLGTRLREEPDTAVLYIDARTLGSTTQFSDLSVPMPKRCLALFRDVLGEIYNALLEYVVSLPSGRAEKVWEKLVLLSNVLSEDARKFVPETVTVTEETTSEATRSLSIDVNATDVLQGAVQAGGTVERKAGAVTQLTSEPVDRIFFPDINGLLSDLLISASSQLVILFDEWSSLPEDVQPYLAEFIKRGVLPVSRATVKIASLEYRSRFALSVQGRILGFELGADIATGTDLDDYYVFDRNPEAITDAYADMLYRHLSSELTEGYLGTTYKVQSGGDLASRLFTERATFKELARASEGVIRDLINIFTKAYFDAHRRGRDSIDRRGIIEAARQWFEQDKAQHLDGHLDRVLQRIVDDVIGQRKARSFLLPRDLERHPVVQKLFDARVLHHMQRGYADKDNPGNRYNIYTLDYGTYVDLLNTSKQPEVDLLEDPAGEELVVPFDDKRSIRRIVLTEDALRP